MHALRVRVFPPPLGPCSGRTALHTPAWFAAFTLYVSRSESVFPACRTGQSFPFFAVARFGSRQLPRAARSKYGPPVQNLRSGLRVGFCSGHFVSCFSKRKRYPGGSSKQKSKDHDNPRTTEDENGMESHGKVYYAARIAARRWPPVVHWRRAITQWQRCARLRRFRRRRLQPTQWPHCARNLAPRRSRSKLCRRLSRFFPGPAGTSWC